MNRNQYKANLKRTKKRKPERNRLSAKCYYPDQVEITSFGTATEKEQLVLVDISTIRSQKLRMKKLYKAFPNDITRRWNNKRIEFSERMMNLLAYSFGQGRTNLRSCLGSYFKKKGFANLTIRKKNTGMLFVKNKCVEKEKKRQERKKQKEMEKKLNNNKQKQEKEKGNGNGKEKEKEKEKGNGKGNGKGKEKGKEIETEKTIRNLKSIRQTDQKNLKIENSSFKIRRKTTQFSKSPRNSVHLNDYDVFAEIDQLGSKIGLNSLNDISFLLHSNKNIKIKKEGDNELKDEKNSNNMYINYQCDYNFSSDDLSLDYESDSNTDSSLSVQNKKRNPTTNLGDEKKASNRNVPQKMKNKNNFNCKRNENNSSNGYNNNSNSNSNSNCISENSSSDLEFESDSDQVLDSQSRSPTLKANEFISLIALNSNKKNDYPLDSFNQTKALTKKTLLDLSQYQLYDFGFGDELNSQMILNDIEDEFLSNSFVIDCSEC
ncbi:hypothetical protein M0812_04457 [Anaeramoeba flamelloides]|uniref:Uncharacterized protein n=1 Tax=Anaeramoeba flamelloides TaxID=1746091 RepID=A0AAV8AFJ4_9EUKA|nr:hypothetical protein M0812_04457 [Anaeramoeba flamelloides]